MRARIKKAKIPMTTGQIIALLRENLTLSDEILQTLPEREEYVVRKSYGIGCDSHSFIEIGRELGVGHQRISQIQKQALYKLRHPSRKEIIVRFVTSLMSPERNPQPESEDSKRGKDTSSGESGAHGNR